MEVAYVDEAGFAPQPPNRSAWSKVGETHAVVSKRSQRLNVIGALLSSGRLMMAKLWHSVNGLWFFGFLMALIERVQKPMVVILDNASIHTAKVLEPYWELLQEKGMRFYFLPPYSPDLNPIACSVIGRLLKQFTPTECANYLVNAGYPSTWSMPRGASRSRSARTRGLGPGSGSPKAWARSAACGSRRCFPAGRPKATPCCACSWAAREGRTSPISIPMPQKRWRVRNSRA